MCGILGIYVSSLNSYSEKNEKSNNQQIPLENNKANNQRIKKYILAIKKQFITTNYRGPDSSKFVQITNIQQSKDAQQQNNNMEIQKNSQSIEKLEFEDNKISNHCETYTHPAKENESFDLYFGFHRLAINDLSDKGNQPMTYKNYTLICNGEIYNSNLLQKTYSIETASGSDCEVILHLYDKFGFDKMIRMLDGVFALLLFDSTSNQLFVARDPFGVRPLFYSEMEYCGSKILLFSSEIKYLIPYQSANNICNTSKSVIYTLDSFTDDITETFSDSITDSLTNHNSNREHQKRKRNIVASKHQANIRMFEPGTWWSIWTPRHTFLKNDGTNLPPYRITKNQHYYYNYKASNDYKICTQECDVEDEVLVTILQNINKLLTTAVKKRLMSDRPIGCLLSGGLDSSLIASLVSRFYKGKQQINTFSIGISSNSSNASNHLQQSTDLYYADIVSKFIGSKHHRVEMTKEDFLNAIPEVIWAIESYDITTVRASVGNYLIAKYIKENTDCVVIFNGDGSDEQSGYRYLQNAPSKEDFRDECHRLLTQIHKYDVLRSDRSVSSRWSLEARTPFLDKTFVDYYMSIDPALKMYNETKIEKYLLRKAFEKDNLLPSEVLWRKKEAFSDGCSSADESWYVTIQKHMDTLITDEEFYNYQKQYETDTCCDTSCKPHTKEAMYYKQIFDQYYNMEYSLKSVPEQIISLNSNFIDQYWMPKWCGEVNDPSARVLKIY